MSPFPARATASAYMALTGPFVLIGLLFTVVAVRRPDAGQVVGGCTAAFVIATAWSVWLAGFRLRVANGRLEYRDGLFRTRAAPLEAISAVEMRWVRWRWLPGTVRVPRLTVLSGGTPAAELLLINPKPFPRTVIAALRRLAKPAHAESRPQVSVQPPAEG